MRRVRQSLVLRHKCRVSCVLALGENRQDRGRRPDAGSEDLAPAFSGLGRVRPAAAAALAALAVEIARQEAVTVRPGAPQGNQNAVKGDKTNGSNTTSCFDSANSERHSNTGLLRRLAKQGRDDLLDRVASGELRKDFTPTERVAIAKAIEEEIGNRQGKRTDLEPVGDCPQVTADKTRAIAAEKAGFGSEVAVVENHTPKSGMKFAVEMNSFQRKSHAKPKAASLLALILARGMCSGKREVIHHGNSRNINR
jgi:hypothetical protein